MLFADLYNAPAEAPSVVRSLLDLQNLVATNTQAIASFSVTGLVCAVESKSRLVALQDGSATLLLELPQVDSQSHPGNFLVVEANHAALTRSPFGIQVGTGPVAEIDGLHPALNSSGRVYLEAGYQPIRVEWFNGTGQECLVVEYEGPETARQKIPPGVLWRRDEFQTGNFRPGVDRATYLGEDWVALPDFQKLKRAALDVVSNFDASHRLREQNVALVFNGFIRIAVAGIYAFHIRSDDGGRIFVGNPAMQCVSTKLDRAPQLPPQRSLDHVLAVRKDREWISVEGRVSFANQNGRLLELEIMDRDQPVSVTVYNAKNFAATNLTQQRVQATGICRLVAESRTPRMIVPGASQLKILTATNLNADETLTTAAQVRRLQPDEARKPFRARVHGVVTMANYWSCVVQDLGGGVFVQQIHKAWPQQPLAGELWEFEGETNPGDFSPIILATNATYLGDSVMPQPIRPTWEQLVNGSMDAELVEIQGIVADVSANEMTLLTRDGKVTILKKYLYSLPRNSAMKEADPILQGSVVRVRGVFAAYWDAATRQLVPGKFYLGNSTLSVDETAPENPFAAPSHRVTDLLLFTSHLGALTRVKLTGQILYAQPREYFLRDGANGFRVLTKEPLPLIEGDLVEAVGFPQLGGPSPVLVEAKARKIGDAPRAAPVKLSIAELSNEQHDATLVQVEALLLSDVVRQGERVLELKTGPQHFLARLQVDANPASLLRRGSTVQLTGVYASVRERQIGNDLGAFELLLNRPTDVVVLKNGPWWTRRHTIATIVILLTGLMASLVWIFLLRRTVAQRTARLEKEINERQRIEQRRVLEQERARIAQDLHDDLGAGLAQIGLVGALAQRPNTLPVRAQEHLSEITDKSREMVTVLDEIVWAINPRHDSTTSVSSYLCDYAQEFLRPTSVACRLDVASTQPMLALNSVQRHQLFLAFKEALTNVIKHAHAAEVWIRIAVNDDDLCITVEDDGRGMSRDGDGDGILNMRMRLKQIGGQCAIHPRPGGGTIVSFRMNAQTRTFS